MCNKCRCCCLGRSTSVIVAAIYTLIQSALWFTAALLFLLSHRCSFTLDSWPWLYGFYLTYLRNPACGDVDLTKLGFSPPNVVEPLMEDGILSHIERTNIIVWIYVVLNGAWIVSSAMLLLGATKACPGKCGHHFTWQPWLWITLANVILDVVATIIFATDVRHADTWPNLLSWIGVKNFQEIATLFTTNTASELPILTMLAFSCRFIIIDLINIWFLLVVTYIYFEMLGEYVNDAPTRFSYERHKARVNRAFEEDIADLNHNGNGNHFRLETNHRQETQLTSPEREMRLGNGHASRMYNRSVSAYNTNEYPDDTDESVERRLKNYQIVGLSSLSPTSDKSNLDYQIKQRQGEHVHKKSNGFEPSRAKSVQPVVVGPPPPPPRVPEPDYDDHNGPHVAAIRESLQRDVKRLSSSAERELHLLNHAPAPVDDNQVARSSSFQTNRPELRNQLPWSYFKADEAGAANKRQYVNPITGQPVNMDRARSRSPVPITEQRSEM